MLPAYGLYARHVRGLTVRNVTFTSMVEDERPAVVLDDVDTATFEDFKAQTKAGVPVFVKVTNTRKREAGARVRQGSPVQNDDGAQPDDARAAWRFRT